MTTWTPPPADLTARSRLRGSKLGYVQLRGVGRCMYAGLAAYPTTPYPLRWACPGTHPTPPASRCWPCWRCSSPSVAARWWARWGGLRCSPTSRGPRRQSSLAHHVGSGQRGLRGLAGVDGQALPAGGEEVSPPWGQKCTALCAPQAGIYSTTLAPAARALSPPQVPTLPLPCSGRPWRARYPTTPYPHAQVCTCISPPLATERNPALMHFDSMGTLLEVLGKG